MDRLHIEVPKVSLRTLPEGASPNMLSMISAGLISTNASVSQGSVSPEFTGLSCHPCLNRRIFAPNGFRPNPRDFLDKANISHGEAFPGEQIMKCMDWGPSQLELDRYSQRYRLQSNLSKSWICSASHGRSEPEDLTMSGSANLDRSGDEDELEEEDEDVDMDDEDEDSSEQSKSVGHLKFSIASILGGKHTVKSPKLLTHHDAGVHKKRAEVSVGRKNDVMTDPEESGNIEKESSLDDKGLDGLLTESDRFSWLQCTRYKPPKLPRSKKKDGSKKRKLGRNPRVPFTQHQVTVLEQKFRQTHYLSSVDVAELSAALNLTETRVKIWFQNRRARERRDRENIQLLQNGPSSTVTGSASKQTPPGAERLSPESGSVRRSPGDLSQDMNCSVSAGLFPHRLPLPAGAVPPLGLGGIRGMGSPPLPPGAWQSPLSLPKPSVLAQFASSHRASAFTPVTYFSYT